MKFTSFAFTLDEIHLDISKISSLLGYEHAELPAPYPEIIQQILQQVSPVMIINGGISLVEESPVFSPESMKINGVSLNIGKQVVHYMKGTEKIAVFVCTAGKEISALSKELTIKGDLVEGYIADVIGSVIVESAMDIIQEKLRNDCITNGTNITNRYSPGYCDWDVSEQHKLFRFLPEKPCGIELSDTALMIPIKSVSGIIGVGEKAVYREYVCDSCKSVKCIYRNLKKTNSIN